MRSSYTFAELPRPIQVQLIAVGPLLLGGVVGFLLGESAAAYWIVTGVGIVGGLAGGLEHPTLRSGALRGIVTGVFFGTGIVVAHAVSGDRALAKVPSPIALLVVAGAVGGCVLGAVGALLRARAAPPIGAAPPIEPTDAAPPELAGGVVEKPNI